MLRAGSMQAVCRHVSTLLISSHQQVGYCLFSLPRLPTQPSLGWVSAPVGSLPLRGNICRPLAEVRVCQGLRVAPIIFHMCSVLSSFPHIPCTFRGAAQLPCKDNRVETPIPTGASDLAIVSKAITDSRGSNSQVPSCSHSQPQCGLAVCLSDSLSIQQALTPTRN